jgi:hypothetical protein
MHTHDFFNINLRFPIRSKTKIRIIPQFSYLRSKTSVDGVICVQWYRYYTYL